MTDDNYIQDYTTLRNSTDFLRAVGDNGIEWGRAVSQIYKKQFDGDVDAGFLGFWFANAIENAVMLRKQDEARKLSFEDQANAEPITT